VTIIAENTQLFLDTNEKGPVFTQAPNQTVAGNCSLSPSAHTLRVNMNTENDKHPKDSFFLKYLTLLRSGSLHNINYSYSFSFSFINPTTKDFSQKSDWGNLNNSYCKKAANLKEDPSKGSNSNGANSTTEEGANSIEEGANST
jgi:hypothetical protein